MLFMICVYHASCILRNPRDPELALLLGHLKLVLYLKFYTCDVLSEIHMIQTLNFYMGHFNLVYG